LTGERSAPFHYARRGALGANVSSMWRAFVNISEPIMTRGSPVDHLPRISSDRVMHFDTDIIAWGVCSFIVLGIQSVTLLKYFTARRENLRLSEELEALKK